MTANLVTLTEAFGSGVPADWLFVAGGTLADDTGAAIVTPIIRGNNMPGGTGILSASLLASDNFSAGQLLWTCFIRVQGLPFIEVHSFPVNFSLGASQVLYTVLKASGWTPTSI
jgi:hypothetical protein